MNGAQHILWGTNVLMQQNRSVWDLTEFQLHLTIAAQMCQDATKYASGVFSASSVANQRDYELPDGMDGINTDGFRLWDSSGYREIEWLGRDEFQRIIPQSAQSYRWTMGDERHFWLFPAPSAAAATTTLTSAIVQGDTTISGADFSSFPAGPARIEIGTGASREVIEYRSKNATDTQLQGLTWALEGTDRRAHSNGATVTLRDIQITGPIRIRDWEFDTFYTTGNATIANDAKAVTGAGSSWLNNIRSGMEFGSTDDVILADPKRWYPIDYVGSNTALTLAKEFLAPTRTSKPYIVANANPLGSRFDLVMQDFLLMQSSFKVGDKKMLEAARERIADALGIAQNAVWSPSNPKTVRSEREMGLSGSRTRGLRVPSHY